MSDEPTEGLRSGPMGLIDGVAVMITEPNERLWRAMIDSGLPVVALDTNPNGGAVDSVLIDNIAGAAEATEHLLSTVPAERCYFVGGPADNFDSKQRAAAFLSVLERRGRTPRAEQTTYGLYSVEWGRAWATRFLKNHADASRREPIGVLAGNDEIAMGVLDVFQSAGIGAPLGLRLVGFDDSRLASLLKPSISSVRVPRAEVGGAAVSALIERIEHPEAAAITRTLPTRLVVRDSSAG
jgi:LacI family transcriptional regulator